MIDVRAEKQWLTAAECAAEALPGLDYDERHIRRWIVNAGIAHRWRKVGTRQAREFHWSSLPQPAREDYLKRHGIASATPALADTNARLAARDLKAEARRLIAEAARAFIAERNLPIGKGLTAYCAAHARRRVDLAAFVFEIEPAPKPHQIRIWDRTLRTKGEGALVDARGRPEGSCLISRDAPLRGYIIATIAARPHLSALDVQKAVRTDLSRELALRTLQSFLARLREENAASLKALSDPDKYRSHHRPAFGSRSQGIDRINQQWQIDATRADAMCVTAEGRRRFALTAVVDVRTRRAMLLVSDQPRAMATCAVLRRAILKWGIPESIKADNGKEFTARAVERFCRDMGIALVYSRPFCPEEKPFVERFFGTLNHQLFPMLPGFVGANVAQRQAIEHRQSFAHRFQEEANLAIETSLSPEGLQARLDAWLAHEYEARIHDGLGMSPADAAAMLGHEVRRVENERALDPLLLPAPDASGLRVIGKRGLQVLGRTYIAAELGALMHERVLVKLDPSDLSRVIVYSHDGERFLCIAEDADVVDNVRRIAMAREAQSLDRKRIANLRADTRKVQQLFPAAGLSDRILANAAGDPFILQDDAKAGMIAATGPRLIEHARASDALSSHGKPQAPIEPTPEQREGAAAAISDFEARNAKPKLRTVQCDGYSRPHFDDDLAFWNWAEAHRASGQTLDAEDESFIRELAREPSFQTLLTTTRAKRA